MKRETADTQTQQWPTFISEGPIEPRVATTIAIPACPGQVISALAINASATVELQILIKATIAGIVYLPHPALLINKQLSKDNGVILPIPSEISRLDLNVFIKNKGEVPVEIKGYVITDGRS